MFEKIDSQLLEWTNLKGLYLSKNYKDTEVRSITILKDNEKKYQIWVEVPRKNQIKINAWDYGKLKAEYSTTIKLFTETLEQAYNIINLWDNASASL